jgi:hypothetical protein
MNINLPVGIILNSKRLQSREHSSFGAISHYPNLQYNTFFFFKNLRQSYTIILEGKKRFLLHLFASQKIELLLEVGSTFFLTKHRQIN